MSIGFAWIDAAVAIFVYLAFLAWYDGWPRRRLSPAELGTYIEKMRAMRAGQGDAAVQAIERFRAFGANDDGGEFHMVNLLRWRPADQNGDAHRRYMRAWAKVAVPRASHPIYRGKVAGKIQGTPEERLWDDVAIMRYRSRRDILKIATSDSFMRDAGQKGVAVEYTDAYPAVPRLLLGSPRILALLVVFVLALLAALVFG
jgi:hypothetical protein